jgi:hypothetical protein
MRFRPANIRVINRRRSFSIGYSLCPHLSFPAEAYQPQLVRRTFPFLRQCRRTVRAVQGSLRRAKGARPGLLWAVLKNLSG